MKDVLLNSWPLIFIGIILIYLVVEYVKHRNEKELLSTRDRARPEALPDILTLSRFSSKMSQNQLKIMVGVMMLSLIGIGIALIAFYFVRHPDQSPAEMLAALLNKLQQDPFDMLHGTVMVMALIAIPFWSLGSLRNERLVLTRQGIRYHSPFKGLLSGLQPGWEMNWSDVVLASMHTGLVRGQLTLKPKQGKVRHLMAHAWHSINDTNKKQFKSAFSRLEYERELQQYPLLALERLPLLRYMREVAGINIETEAKGELNFDLANNQHTRLLLLILFGLMAYTLIDFVMNDEAYVQPPPLTWFVISGVLVAVLSIVWLNNKSVPKSNVWGLSLILGLIAGIAMYPALLRINQLTDEAGLQAFEYRQVSTLEFQPSINGLPMVVMPAHEYWASLEKDTSVYFSLRKGGLGFYQIDMAPENAKMRQWSCRQYAKADPLKLSECDNG